MLRGNLAPDGAVIKPSAAIARTAAAHAAARSCSRTSRTCTRRIDDEALDIDETCVHGAEELRPEGLSGHGRGRQHAAAARSCCGRACATWCASPTRACPAPPTAPSCCTWRRRRPPAGRWRWCRTATGSRSTSRGPACTCTSTDAELAAAPAAGWRRRRRTPTRGYSKLYVEHVLQADRGRATSTSWSAAAARRRAGATITQRWTAHGPAPMPNRAPYRGVFPVAPTTFDDDGALDLDSQRRCIDFMIDAGSQRHLHPRQLLRAVRAGRRRARACHAHRARARGRPRAGDRDDDALRTPVCAERSRRAQAPGAAMVMIMPPYHGATIRVPEAAIVEFFARVSDAIYDSDHDPGRAGRRHAAVGRLAGADGARDRATSLLQDRDRRRGRQAARADRPRRRRRSKAPGTARKPSRSIPTLRWLLIEAVYPAVRKDPALRQDYQRLKFRRGHAVAKVAIARKLAVRMYWMLRSGAEYAQLVRRQGSPGATLVDASSSLG